MFIPYIAYLLIIQYLSGNLIGAYFDSLVAMDPEEHKHRNWYAVQAYVLVPTCLLLLVSFALLEVQQVFQKGLPYFHDGWNCIDMASIYLNFVMLVMFSTSLIR